MVTKEHCGLIDLYKLLGRKWSIPILLFLKKENHTFGELYSISRRYIHPTLLSDRLKEMIKLGIIEKGKNKKKNIYMLTKKGDELFEILEKTKKWVLSTGNAIPHECSNEVQACIDFFNRQ